MRKKSADTAGKTTPEKRLKAEFVKRVQDTVCTVYEIPTVAELRVKKRKYAPAKRTVARILKKAGCTRSQIAEATGLSVYGVSATLEVASDSKWLSTEERKKYLRVVDKLCVVEDNPSLGLVSPYDKGRKSPKSTASLALPPLQRIEVLDKMPAASLPTSQGAPTSFVPGPLEESEKRRAATEAVVREEFAPDRSLFGSQGTGKLELARKVVAFILVKDDNDEPLAVGKELGLSEQQVFAACGEVGWLIDYDELFVSKIDRVRRKLLAVFP